MPQEHDGQLSDTDLSVNQIIFFLPASLPRALACGIWSSFPSLNSFYVLTSSINTEIEFPSCFLKSTLSILGMAQGTTVCKLQTRS